MQAPPKKFKIHPLLDYLGYIVMMVGVFLCLGANCKSELLKHSSETPEEITAAKLAADKTCSNWHVKITDYTIEKSLIVKKGSSITYVEVNLIPKGPPTSTQIRVRNFMVNDENKAAQFADQSSIDGVIVPQTTIDPSYFSGSMRLLPNNNLVDIKVARYPKSNESSDENRWGIICFVGALVWTLVLMKIKRG